MRLLSALLLFLMPGLLAAKDYPESFDYVATKYQHVGIKGLNEKEQAIYTIWWLESEVNNGGFHQYFWNSAGDDAKLALDSLNKIGATKTAALLEKAIEIAFPEGLPNNRTQRQVLLEIDEDAKFEQLAKVDYKFYEYSEDFYQLLNNFKSNKN